MSKNESLPQKTKIIIYISCAIAAVVAAVGAVCLVLHLCQKDVPTSSYISSSAISVSKPLTEDDYDMVEIIEPEEDQQDNSSDQTSSENSENSTPDDTASKNEKPNKKDPEQQQGSAGNENSVDTSALTKRKVKLPVKYLSQTPELPAGCEITSLTTVLNYLGFDVSKVTMSDDFLKKSNTVDDFYKVYVGDPKSNGFGCYAQPIVDAAKKYLKTQESNYTAINLSDSKFEDLLVEVQNGTPVIIWSTMYSKKSQNLLEPYVSKEWVVNGKKLKWLANEHCMVLIGYDIDREVAIMSDPLRGIVEYDLETVKARYISMHSQAVILRLSDVAPVIKGVADGENYYTTQQITIKDENLSSVTVNDKTSESQFYINGNTEATYKITATDNAGNSTTVTVHTKPIAEISGPIADLSESNVTSDNRDAVNSVRDIALGIATDHATEEEISAIDEIIISCDNMLDKILAVTNEYNRISIAVSDYDDEIPQAEDKDIITSILSDIQTLAATSNLTAEQQQTLANYKTKCEELLSMIPPTEDITPPEDNGDTPPDETDGDSQGEVPDDSQGENGGDSPEENPDVLMNKLQDTAY